MADNTPADTPTDTPTAPQFPEQTYRDRSTSSNSDNSDSGPRIAIPNHEPSKSPTEGDRTAGPAQPFHLDPARLNPNPFRPPPPGPPGVNAFAGLPVPPQPPSDQRDSRSKTAHGSSPPTQPPTRGSAAGRRAPGTASPGKSPRTTPGPSAPRRPSAKRTIKLEESSSGGRARSSVPPPSRTSPVRTASAVPRPGPSGSQRTASAPRNPHPRKQQPKKNSKAAPRARREAIVTGPARNTRGQRRREGRGGSVEFGFGDLDRLARRLREERRKKRGGVGRAG